MDVTRYITLPNLYKLLINKAISTIVLGVSFLFIFSRSLVGIVVLMISALAIPFSIYMLVTLYDYNKTGWIFGFIIWMSISFLPFFLLPNDSLFLLAAKYVPLLFFVLYTFLLKMKVGEWLLERGFELETIK